MKQSKLVPLILSSLILAACSGGGGGGGGGGNNNSAPTSSTSANNTQSATQETTANTTGSANNSSDSGTATVPDTPTTNLNNSGTTISKDDFKKGELNNVPVTNGDTEVAKLSGYNRQYSFNGALTKTSEKEIGEIIVDGSVRLGIRNLTGSVGGLTGYALSKALNAAWNATKDPERDVFYFGYETPESNIPKQGTVTYKGNASRYDSVTAKVQNVGDAELIANFDTKTIKGELDMTYPRRNISLKETAIVANGFSGQAVAEGNLPFFITREGQYEGKFYGPNAEEVAGKATFDESVKDLNTSFSAEKVQ